jgi:hypothetical protein
VSYEHDRAFAHLIDEAVDDPAIGLQRRFAPSQGRSAESGKFHG